MKTKFTVILVLVLAFAVFAFSRPTLQNPKEPWTPQQLMDPADLAALLKNPKSAKPVVYSIGPMAVIKGSVEIGPAWDKENQNKLKAQLSKLPKDANIVIYCGCCPFDRCPNIRPAFELLNSMHFRNHKLLNLPHNIKVDWMNYGYPVNE